MIVLLVAWVSTALTGCVRDDESNRRLSELETRVARLEGALSARGVDPLSPPGRGGGSSPATTASNDRPGAQTATECVASRNAAKFHRPTCSWAGKIHNTNLRRFKDSAEAVRAGLSPCAVCKPDQQ